MKVTEKLECMWYLQKNGIDTKHFTFSDLENIFKAMEHYRKDKHHLSKRNNYGQLKWNF